MQESVISLHKSLAIHKGMLVQALEPKIADEERSQLFFKIMDENRALAKELQRTGKQRDDAFLQLAKLRFAGEAEPALEEREPVIGKCSRSAAHEIKKMKSRMSQKKKLAQLCQALWDRVYTQIADSKHFFSEKDPFDKLVAAANDLDEQIFRLVADGKSSRRTAMSHSFDDEKELQNQSLKNDLKRALRKIEELEAKIDNEGEVISILN